MENTLLLFMVLDLVGDILRNSHGFFFFFFFFFSFSFFLFLFFHSFFSTSLSFSILRRLIDVFQSDGIDFQMIDVVGKSELVQAITEFADYKSFPLVFIGGKFIGLFFFFFFLGFCYHKKIINWFFEPIF